MIKTLLNELRDKDIYTLILFVLYKIHPLPEYSSLSELAYVLDKNSILKLCEFFGGQVIRIPTIDEFEDLIYALLFYSFVHIESTPYEEAKIRMKDLGCVNISKIEKQYIKIKEALKEYDFQPGRTF